MSLYKLGISDKTIGAMQNADPEVQKMMLESQQNNTQPDSGGGILDIIKELFGFGSAEASDLGAIANNEMLQSILNPKTPTLGENLYDPPGRRILASRIRPEVDTEPLSYSRLSPINLMPDPDYPEYAEVDMGATGTIPTLNNTGIMSAVNNVPFGTSVDNIQGFTDKEDFSEVKPTGIARLFEFLGNIPTPFNLVRRGLESLSGVNQRLRNTDFGQSKTLQEYFQRREARKEAERLAPIQKQLREASERGGGYQPTTRSQNVARTASRVSGGKTRAYGL